MEAHVGDRIVVHSTHQGEPDRTGEVDRVRTSPTGGPPYRVRWEPDGHEGLFYPAGTATVVHADRLQRADRADGEGHRDRTGPAAGDAGAQRGPRRPRGGGQDHAGRGAARRDRGAAAGRPGRGRHDVPGHRGRRGPAAAVGVAGRRDRRARRPPHHPAGHPRGRRTSWASCAPACAPPMPRCSSSPPSTGWTPPPSRSGRSARRSACRARSCITQLDRARADVDEAVRLCQVLLGEGVFPRAPGRPGPRRLGARPGLPARARRDAGRAGARPTGSAPS